MKELNDKCVKTKNEPLPVMCKCFSICEICGSKVNIKAKNYKSFEAWDKFNVYLCAKHRHLGFNHSGKKSYYDHTKKYMIPMNILDFKKLYKKLK